jgi:hypothetical protein
MSSDRAETSSSGFQAAVASLPLVDVLQVWSMNRFSGMVSVTGRGRQGHLYFVDGEIVHAEADDLVGEPAVQAILSWPDSAFEPFPNTSTLKRTILKRVSHLILDALRVLDERRHATPPPVPPAPPPMPAPAARAPAGPSVMDQIRATPGVTQLVRFGKDGRPTAGQGPEAEALAAKGMYLAMTHAAAVAQAFGLQDLSVASLQGRTESLVLVHSAGNYLCLAVTPGVPLEPLVSQVRALLTRVAAR